ncbi:MAG: hypothetical protein H6742_03230 [Alphaproteobacteria bacterium]|nr:hypothetical protein [Alphaproteobacteria bacterium]
MQEHSGPEATPVRWTWRPHREQPGRVALAALVVAATAFAVGTIDPWLAALGTALLVGTLADGLFPTHYRLSPGVAESRGFLARRRLDRSACRAVRGSPPLVLLEADARHALLRRRRSIILRGAPPAAVAVLASWTAQSADRS